MDLFTGPFAFLIYSKLEKEYYVVRGETKKLHIATIQTGDVVGFVINTEKDDLECNLENTIKMLHLVDVKATCGDAELVPEKTINIVDVKNNCITKVGDVKENKPYVAPVTTYATGAMPIANEKVMNTIYNFMYEIEINITELDNLMNYLFGYGMAYMGKDDYEEFADFYIPKLMGYFTVQKRVEVNELYNMSTHTNMIELLNEHGLQFPYFLNKYSKLKKALDAAMKPAEPEAKATQLPIQDKLPSITEVP
jgi:hypothetical protein